MGWALGLSPWVAVDMGAPLSMGWGWGWGWGWGGVGPWVAVDMEAPLSMGWIGPCARRSPSAHGMWQEGGCRQTRARAHNVPDVWCLLIQCRSLRCPHRHRHPTDYQTTWMSPRCYALRYVLASCEFGTCSRCLCRVARRAFCVRVAHPVCVHGAGLVCFRCVCCIRVQVAEGAASSGEAARKGAPPDSSLTALGFASTSPTSDGIPPTLPGSSAGALTGISQGGEGPPDRRSPVPPLPLQLLGLGSARPHATSTASHLAPSPPLVSRVSPACDCVVSSPALHSDGPGQHQLQQQPPQQQQQQQQHQQGEGRPPSEWSVRNGVVLSPPDQGGPVQDAAAARRSGFGPTDDGASVRVRVVRGVH